MNRREMGSIVVALFCSSIPALAAADHSSHMRRVAAGGDFPVNKKLVDTASDCVKAGQACIAHCFESFSAGDTSLAACARLVDQMMSVCGTLEKLAAAGSASLPGLAKVALGVCEDCEKECRKHADHHATCKACAESCKACAEACRLA
jgi:Cys-rich four helix bundle protein (predicted Tat secretion target)